MLSIKKSRSIHGVSLPCLPNHWVDLFYVLCFISYVLSAHSLRFCLMFGFCLSCLKFDLLFGFWFEHLEGYQGT